MVVSFQIYIPRTQATSKSFGRHSHCQVIESSSQISFFFSLSYQNTQDGFCLLPTRRPQRNRQVTRCTRRGSAKGPFRSGLRPDKLDKLGPASRLYAELQDRWQYSVLNNDKLILGHLLWGGRLRRRTGMVDRKFKVRKTSEAMSMVLKLI